MKKLLFVFVFTFTISALFAQVNKVEVSFDFTRQTGFATNQFAVWVEDAQGKHIKTLYATKFTATGGWKRRELSLPLWVKQSNLADMDKTRIDAITGPTPKNGTLCYNWDGKDSMGQTLANGEYRVFVEATLRNENRVLYTAVVKLGEKSRITVKIKGDMRNEAAVNVKLDESKGQPAAQVQYFGTSAAERGMIGPVTVIY